MAEHKQTKTIFILGAAVVGVAILVEVMSKYKIGASSSNATTADASVDSNTASSSTVADTATSNASASTTSSDGSTPATTVVVNNTSPTNSSNSSALAAFNFPSFSGFGFGPLSLGGLTSTAATTTASK